MLVSLFSRIVQVCKNARANMLMVAIAWIYVVLMMSITEETVVAGVMTFLLYGVLPLSIILYLMATPQRRRKREAAEKIRRLAAQAEASSQNKE
jgi:hypothetical protein